MPIYTAGMAARDAGAQDRLIRRSMACGLPSRRMTRPTVVAATSHAIAEAGPGAPLTVLLPASPANMPHAEVR